MFLCRCFRRGGTGKNGERLRDSSVGKEDQEKSSAGNAEGSFYSTVSNMVDPADVGVGLQPPELRRSWSYTSMQQQQDHHKDEEGRRHSSVFRTSPIKAIHSVVGGGKQGYEQFRSVPAGGSTGTSDYKSSAEVEDVSDDAIVPFEISVTVDGRAFFPVVARSRRQLAALWVAEQAAPTAARSLGVPLAQVRPLALKVLGGDEGGEGGEEGRVVTMMEELDPGRFRRRRRGGGSRDGQLSGKGGDAPRLRAMFYSTNNNNSQNMEADGEANGIRIVNNFDDGSTKEADQRDLDLSTSLRNLPSCGTPARRLSRTLSAMRNQDDEQVFKEMLLEKAPITAMLNAAETGVYSNTWEEPEGSSFKVRGPCYLADRRKQPSADSAYLLLGMELVADDRQRRHAAAQPGSFARRYREAAGDQTPFLFVINFVLPFGNYCAYFCPRTMGRTPYIGDKTFDALLLSFIEGTDEYRNRRMKIIPRCIEGPWVVRTAVGQTPAIMGTKIQQNYYSTKEYFELEVNVQSSKAAGTILAAVKSFTKLVSIDLAFVLQGENEAELPERILGCLRFYKLDVAGAPPSEEWESRPPDCPAATAFPHFYSPTKSIKHDGDAEGNGVKNLSGKKASGRRREKDDGAGVARNLLNDMGAAMLADSSSTSSGII